MYCLALSLLLCSSAYRAYRDFINILQSKYFVRAKNGFRYIAYVRTGRNRKNQASIGRAVKLENTKETEDGFTE